MEETLKNFFYPATVAIVGASREPGKIGNDLVKNLIEAGYKGKIFPINPKAEEILGLKAYPSIIEVPNSPDLAVIATPSRFVPSIIHQCAKKGVKATIIISGGFREAGETGRQLEKDLTEIAKKSGIRVIGPNCQGVTNPHIGLCATFGGFTSLPGPIAVITQSGSVGGALQCWADIEGIGISKCINLGNKIDVNETHLLRYLGTDSTTKVIALYLEGVTDGGEFMKAATEVTKTKPIVALKGGVTKAGAKATLSHTSSLAGRPEIFEAALKQTGVIKANTLEELYDIAKAFSLVPLPEGPGVLIVESTGGLGILAADMCEEVGLMLAEPAEEAKERLREVLPSFCTFSNPFDLTSEGLDADSFRLVIEENKDNDKFHAFLTIFGDPVPDAAEVIKQISEEIDKPIVVAYLGGGEVERTEREKMQSVGIPVFPSPERAVVALSALVKYACSRADTEVCESTYA